MRSGSQAIGELRPSYRLDGVPDLTAGISGDWAVLLRDGTGATLGRFPFEPEWRLHDPPEGRPSGEPSERNFMGFSYQVPDLPGLDRMDLVGPTGLLDSLTFGDNSPTVSIVEPTSGARATAVDGKARLPWIGPDAEGLLYPVFYSTDGAATWLIQRFEQSETELDLEVDLGAQDHLVKVIVTGGANSSEAISAFSVTVGSTVAPMPVPSGRTSPSSGLAPLISANNLVRVWNFDNSSKAWAFFDPRPAFAAASTITGLVSGEVYWIKVASEQTATLNGKEVRLFAGWNVVAWWD